MNHSFHLQNDVRQWNLQHFGAISRLIDASHVRYLRMTDKLYASSVLSIKLS